MFTAAAVLCLLAAACYAAPPAKPPLWLGRVRGQRIIGGEPADISQYPWQVSLQQLDAHYCGGSVISLNWVITAAHCLYFQDITLFFVRAGTSTRESGGSVYGIAAAHLNEAFDYGTGDCDIAAVSISGSFTFGPNVQAVNIGDVEPEEGALVTVSGWGALSSDADVTEQLQAVTVPVVGRDTCYSVWGATQNMICAGGQGAGMCWGDSGSPLVANSTLLGVASQGFCATPGIPEVYTNVAALRTWIRETTGA
ncbi:trypsin delta-like [Schistocerca serialis cubense]|uniref:trypsin delta-like n=1 Tax=Schistocerca serialis cubense TaxID=2023355 RepID=UPI00214F103C|nr:trypsin delta-like [Schistocerca serialis cubense]